MVAQERTLLAARSAFERLGTYVLQSAEEGVPIHEVERALWGQVLELGRLLLEGYVTAQGDGDVGETWKTEDGRSLKRLAEPPPRRYVSVFGELSIARQVYASRAKQRLEVVPLDARLELPAGDFSALLEEWAQAHCVHHAFAEARHLLGMILGLHLPVRTLEHMTRSRAETVAAFREQQGASPAATEGEVVVLMADGKGIPMRRRAEDPRPADPNHLTKGEKRNKKRMAYIGVSYTLERFPRTVEDLVKEVYDGPGNAPERPQPQHKRLHAELREQPGAGREALFEWLGRELTRRDPDVQQPVVFLSDGESKLEELAQQYLVREGAAPVTSVLDLMHALPRLWDAAHCFHPEGSNDCKDFVTSHLVRLLSGDVEYVIRGLRQRATKRRLPANKRKTVAAVTAYFEKNRHRMKYDQYLAAGYPLGTGVVEGACRHVIKDRFERSGMRWSLPGADALLSLRTTYLNGDWEAFSAFRIQHETERLYPYRETLSQHLN